MPVLEHDKTFGHPSDAFSNTIHALLAVAFESGTCRHSLKNQNVPFYVLLFTCFYLAADEVRINGARTLRTARHVLRQSLTGDES